MEETPIITTDVGVATFSEMRNSSVNTLKLAISMPEPVKPERHPPTKPVARSTALMARVLLHFLPSFSKGIESNVGLITCRFSNHRLIAKDIQTKQNQSLR